MKYDLIESPVMYVFTLPRDKSEINFKFPQYGLWMSFKGLSQFHGHGPLDTVYRGPHILKQKWTLLYQKVVCASGNLLNSETEETLT
jgi:hypothetical protein